MQFPNTSLNRSDKYKIISTEQVNGIFQAKGYELARVQFKRSRIKANQPFAKHVLRYRIPTDLTEYKPEIVLINSYDGTNSFRLLLGAYRLVCANGLVVGTGFDGVNIKHIGDVVSRLETGIDKIVASAPLLEREIVKLSAKTLSGSDIVEVVKKVELVLERKTDLLSRTLGQVNRPEDKGDSAWLVLNKLQEFVVRGQYRYMNSENKDTKSRAVKSIDQTIKLNRAIWDAISEVA